MSPSSKKQWKPKTYLPDVIAVHRAILYVETAETECKWLISFFLPKREFHKFVTKDYTWKCNTESFHSTSNNRIFITTPISIKMNSTDADQTIGIDRLYKNYEILSDAKDKITEVCLCVMFYPRIVCVLIIIQQNNNNFVLLFEA